MDEITLAEYREKLTLFFNHNDDKTKRLINASVDLNIVEIINEIYPKIEKYLPKKVQVEIVAMMDESMMDLYNEMRWLNRRHKNKKQ